MNKKRLKQLSELTSKLEDIHTELESIITDEETAYDNLPESLQSSDKGSDMEEGLEYIRDAESQLSEAIDNLNNFDFLPVETKEEKLKKAVKLAKEKIKNLQNMDLK